MESTRLIARKPIRRWWHWPEEAERMGNLAKGRLTPLGGAPVCGLV